MAKYLRKTFVPNFFATITISCSFLYKLVTYYWKVLKESYNFVVKNISIKIHMKKWQSHNISNTFVPKRTWLFFGQLKRLLLWAHGWSHGVFHVP
jgi:hypothetical protein